MSAAVTYKIYFSITSVEFVLETVYQLIGQRTHSNGKTPRRLRGIGFTRSIKRSRSVLRYTTKYESNFKNVNYIIT
jgi:hypothetical protein